MCVPCHKGMGTNMCACAAKNHPDIHPHSCDEGRTWICLFYCQNIKANSRRSRRSGLIVIRGRCRQRCTSSRVETRGIWSWSQSPYLLATFGLTPQTSLFAYVDGILRRSWWISCLTAVAITTTPPRRPTHMPFWQLITITHHKQSPFLCEKEMLKKYTSIYIQ